MSNPIHNSFYNPQEPIPPNQKSLQPETKEIPGTLVILGNQQTGSTKSFQATPITEESTKNIEHILNLIKSAEDISSLDAIIRNVLSNSTDATEAFFYLVSLSDIIRSHERDLEFASKAALGMKATSDLTSLGSAIFKYLIIREAEKFVSEGKLKDNIPPDKLLAMEGLISKQWKELKEKTLVAGLRGGCTSFRVFSATLNVSKDTAIILTPIIAIVGWVVTFVEVGLQAYNVIDARDSMKIVEDYIKKNKPIEIDTENTEKANKKFKNLLESIKNRPFDEILQVLRNESIFDEEFNTIVQKIKADGFKSMIKRSPQAVFRILANMCKVDQGHSQTKLELLQGVIKTLEKELQKKDGLQDEVIERMWVELEMALTLKEQTALLDLDPKALMSNRKLLQRINPAAQVINDLIDKRKEAFQKNLKATESQFKTVIKSFEKMSLKDIEKWITDKGVIFDLPEERGTLGGSNLITFLDKRKEGAFIYNFKSNKQGLLTTLKQIKETFLSNKELQLQQNYPGHKSLSKEEIIASAREAKEKESGRPLNQVEIDSINELKTLEEEQLEALEAAIEELETIDPRMSTDEISKIKTQWKVLEPLLSLDEAYSLFNEELIDNTRGLILHHLSKPNVQAILHKAYVRSQEASITMIKQTMKNWAAKSTAFHHDWLVFTYRKELIIFAALSLTTLVSLGLTILTLTGVIACPPVVLVLLGGIASVTSISLLLMGVHKSYKQKPNIFKTYFSAQYLSLQLAGANVAIVQLYYSIIVKLSSLIGQSDEQKIAQLKAQQEHLKKLEDDVAKMQERIDQIAWKDTAVLSKLGTKGLPSEEVSKQLRDFLLLDKSLILQLIADQEFADLLQRYMGIDIPSLIITSKGKPEQNMDDVFVDALIKKIEGFMIQDNTALLTNINVQTSR